MKWYPNTAINTLVRSLALLPLTAAISLPVGAGEVPNQERQQELSYMLKHDCGSCHGMTLKGGLGPSILPHQLQEKGHTRDSIALIIRHGVPEKAMPPWGPILSEEDIRWLAAELLQDDQEPVTEQ